MKHVIKIPVIRWPAAGCFCALTHCGSFTHCDISPYKYICVGSNVSDCIAHGHWPVSHMLSAGGPVGAQLPCSALCHTWGGESRGLFICLLTCFVSFLVFAYRSGDCPGKQKNSGQLTHLIQFWMHPLFWQGRQTCTHANKSHGTSIACYSSIVTKPFPLLQFKG